MIYAGANKFTILSGQSTSETLKLPPGRYIQTLAFPATIDGTSFTIKESLDGGITFLSVYNSGNIAVPAQQFTINYAASRSVRLMPADFFGMDQVQFVSNATQMQDVVILVRYATF